MPPRLSVVSGPHAGEVIPISQGKLLIGREEDCHVRPDSEFVSRHHCVLLLDEYTLRVRDLGSKNGTYVNGTRIGSGERILLHGDMLAIGEMMCQVDLDQLARGRSHEPAKNVDSHAAALLGTGVFEGDTVQAEIDTIQVKVPEVPLPEGATGMNSQAGDTKQMTSSADT